MKYTVSINNKHYSLVFSMCWMRWWDPSILTAYDWFSQNIFKCNWLHTGDFVHGLFSSPFHYSYRLMSKMVHFTLTLERTEAEKHKAYDYVSIWNSLEWWNSLTKLPVCPWTISFLFFIQCCQNGTDTLCHFAGAADGNNDMCSKWLREALGDLPAGLLDGLQKRVHALHRQQGALAGVITSPPQPGCLARSPTASTWSQGISSRCL